jgi:putative transposase
VDGLSGFLDVIETIYPKTEIQLCVIHQICNSVKYVASKNQKTFMVDLKDVYRATTKNATEVALDELENKWGQQYPVVLNPDEPNGIDYRLISNTRITFENHLH